MDKYVLSDDDYKAMKDYDEMMKEIDQEIADNKNKIFNELKTILSKYKLKQLKEYLSEELDNTFSYEIVSEDKIFGTKQEEPYWFKYIFIRQTVGYLGDDYSGTIFVPITKDKFFKFCYEC